MSENRLIELLPRTDQARLRDVCKPIQLELSEVLYERGKVTRHVFFPTDGFISLVSAVDGHAGIEVGMVGREGMLGAHLALGLLPTPLMALVQGSGEALQIKSSAFRTELLHSAPLRRLINRYLYVMMAEMATSAACLRFHRIGPRLARWLLMTQDRAHADQFHVTHEFLAYMLGVRRVGVTGAASSLRRNGLIEYTRGEITILDRRGLEAAACPCYVSNLASYAAILEPADPEDRGHPSA